MSHIDGGILRDVGLGIQDRIEPLSLEHRCLLVGLSRRR
jgi:hypothetical protein